MSDWLASTASRTTSASVHRLLAQLELVLRDPRDVEQVVDQADHVLHLAFGMCRARSTSAASSRVEPHDLQRAADRRERVAQLVREHRQELVLATVARREIGGDLRSASSVVRSAASVASRLLLVPLRREVGDEQAERRSAFGGHRVERQQRRNRARPPDREARPRPATRHCAASRSSASHTGDRRPRRGRAARGPTIRS